MTGAFLPGGQQLPRRRASKARQKRGYQLADDVARGEFTIPIARTMPLSEIQQAQKLAESHGTNGKIILVP